MFVYGTLTDPGRVAAVLADGADDLEYEFANLATLEGLHRVDGEYPTLAPGGSVDGRLLEVDPAGIEMLDAYEGVERGLYVRVAVPVADDGTAWVYVGDPDALAVADAVSWPPGRQFRDRVQTYLERERVVVRRASDRA